MAWFDILTVIFEQQYGQNDNEQVIPVFLSVCTMKAKIMIL